MPGAIFTIGRSGLSASRLALELTAQNVANAANPDYSRRSLTQGELVMSGRIGISGSADSLGGIRPGDVVRAESALVQRQARDTSSALAAANAEFVALREAESALETSRLFGGLVAFEAALTRLEGSPLDPALRLSALESARQLAASFRGADAALANARSLVQDEARADVLLVNELSAELAKINRELVASREGTAGRASLLDARDKALRGLAEQFGIAATVNADGTADVAILGSPPVPLVTGGASVSVSIAVAPDGTLSFSADGTGFAPASGKMGGRASALAAMVGLQSDLDTVANRVVTIANAAQASGADLDGNPGAALFSGTSAADIALVLTSPNGLATAPAGAPAGSRSTANLAALLTALGGEDGPGALADRLLLSLSSRVSSLNARREGLSIVYAGAEAELLRETGVDLDTEAANLVRLQQAFEANSRVIQVATELFDTLLGLR